jgi:diguanylate cyclase (GGDEF)-like protein/PAS domain S-box-containing protein
MHRFRHTYLRSILLIILAAAGVLSLHPADVRGQGGENPKVLVLNSYHKGFAWTDDATEGITEVLKSSALDPIIYTEYADWKRFPTRLGMDNLYASLLYKYAGTDIDLVLTTDDFALEFALKSRAQLFNNAPVVFSGVNSTSAMGILKDRTNVTGVLENVDPTETIRNALTINPDIKNVYVLFDHSESGLTTGRIVTQKIHELDPTLKIVPMDNMTFSQVLNTASSLQVDSDIILMTSYFSDIHGDAVEFEGATKQLSQKSAVPVYNIYDFSLNHGAFGGSMISGRQQGAEAARLAMRILGGEKADEIPLVPTSGFRTVFDYEMLQRFGISADQLPKNSEIVGKPFSFYETYHTLVLRVVSAFILLVAFIAVLLVYIRQVRQMRKKLAKSYEEMISLNEELEASEEELRQQFDELSDVKDSLAKSEERFRLATYGSDAVIWDLDIAAMTYYLSDRWYELLGYARDELDERNGGWRSIVHPEDAQEAENQRQAHLRGETTYYNSEYRMRAKSGQYVWFQVRGKISRDHQHNNVRFAGSMTDITERKEYEVKLQISYQELEATYEELTALQEELKEQFDKLLDNQNELVRSEERYRLITEATNDGIWEFDYRTNERFISQRWWELLQIDPAKVPENYSFTELIHPDDLGAYNQCLEEHRSGKSDYYQCEYRLRLGTGEYRWFLGRGKALFDSNNEAYRVAGSDTDIHALKEYQKKLHELAYFDPLCNLPNKLSLTNELDRFFKSGAKGKAALYFLDIDNFKYINDTMGHTFGDSLLKSVSRRLMSLSDKHASFYRLGGDEFVIFLQNKGAESDITAYAEVLLKGLNEPFLIGDSSIHISASIGIAQYPGDGRNAEELLMNADVAMYKAKEKGKGSYELYGHSLQKSFTERMTIEKHLRNALSNGEFELYYQPQFQLQDGRVTGFEALIRWNSPELGSVSPLSFIRIAEDCQLILPIGAWVLSKACSFIKGLQLQGEGNYRISVNISIVQLIQEDFIEMVLGALQQSELAPEYLEIEITESIFMESFEAIVEKLDFLKSMGVRIALDDFGTGYSSLSYLKELPITTLKVDKTFIDDVPDQPGSRSLASSIVMIGHKMGLEVIAEGVEKAEQLQYLRTKNCDKVQGYFISRPLPEKEISGWLQQADKLEFLPAITD